MHQICGERKTHAHIFSQQNLAKENIFGAVWDYLTEIFARGNKGRRWWQHMCTLSRIFENIFCVRYLRGVTRGEDGDSTCVASLREPPSLDEALILPCVSRTCICILLFICTSIFIWTKNPKILNWFLEIILFCSTFIHSFFSGSIYEFPVQPSFDEHSVSVLSCIDDLSFFLLSFCRHDSVCWFNTQFFLWLNSLFPVWSSVLVLSCIDNIYFYPFVDMTAR